MSELENKVNERNKEIGNFIKECVAYVKAKQDKIQADSDKVKKSVE